MVPATAHFPSTITGWVGNKRGANGNESEFAESSCCGARAGSKEHSKQHCEVGSVNPHFVGEGLRYGEAGYEGSGHKSFILFSRDSDLEELVYRVCALGHCALSAVLRILA